MSDKIKDIAKKLANVAVLHGGESQRDNKELIAVMMEMCINDEIRKVIQKRKNASVLIDEDMIIETFFFNLKMDRFSGTSTSNAVKKIKHILSIWENNREKYIKTESQTPNHSKERTFHKEKNESY